MLLGWILLVSAGADAMARIEKSRAVAFGLNPRRLLVRPTLAGAMNFLSQSFDPVPAYFEPAREAQAYARWRWPGWIILSECRMHCDHQQHPPDPEFWQPIHAHCRASANFQIHQRRIRWKASGRRIGSPGAHRGRCRYHRHHRCRLMSCTTDWLKDLVRRSPLPRFGLVQAPQITHRDGNRFSDALGQNGDIRLLRHRHGPAQ